MQFEIHSSKPHNYFSQIYKCCKEDKFLHNSYTVSTTANIWRTRKVK